MGRVPRARLLLPLTLACLLIALVPAAAVQVLPSQGTLPQPLNGYGGATVDGTGYLIGGETGNGYTDQILRLSSSGTVTQATTLPRSLKEPGTAGIAGKVHIFGGAEEGPQGLPRTTADILVYEPGTGEVEDPVGRELPYAISSAPAVAFQGFIYIFGGLSITGDPPDLVVDYKDRILRYDPGTGEITTLSATLPSGRAQMTATVADGRILVIGGMGENTDDGRACPEADDNVCFMDDILAFTPGGNQGELVHLAELPYRVRWAASATADGMAYLMGGCRENCGAHFGLDNITRIDPSSGRATELPIRMPVRGGQRTAVMFGDTAHLPGGIHPTSGTYERAQDDRIHRLELGATRPWSPASLTAEPGPENSVALTWSPPTYDGDGELQSYVIKRGADGRPPVQIDEIPASSRSYTDATVELGTRYTYTVQATNAAGISSASQEAVITPTDVPGAPTLTAQGGDQRIVARWSEPSSSGGSAVDTYRLYIREADQEEATPWADLSGRYVVIDRMDNGSGEQATLVNGQAYVLQVQAHNDNGWGPLSEPVEAVPAEVPATPTGFSLAEGLVEGRPVVNLSWDPSGNPEVRAYAVYRGTTVANLERLATTEKVTYQDEEPNPIGQEIHYAVAAIAGEHESPVSRLRTALFPTPPGNVTNLEARWAGTHAEAWWQPPDDSGGASLTGYEVARTIGLIDPAEDGANITQLDGPPYIDEDPPRGRTLVYHVRALGPGGASDWAITQVLIPRSEGSAPPHAALSVNPSNTKVGQTVILDASGSSDDEAVVAYSFDMGDGTTTGWTNEPRIEHTYRDEGVYTATVEVRDIKGKTSPEPAQSIVTVGPGPDTEDGAVAPTEPGTDGTPLPLWPVIVAVALATLLRRSRP